MTIRSTAGTLAGVALAFALSACGEDGETRTVVQTVTQTVTVPAPATEPPAGETPADDDDAGATPTGPDPAEAPTVPDGLAAVHGLYDMREVENELPGGDLAVEPDEFRSSGETACAPSCRLRLRLRLPLGAIKTYELKPNGRDRWAGTATGAAICSSGPDSSVSSTQRISVRVADRRTIGSAPVASEIEVYLRVRQREFCDADQDVEELLARFRGVLREP